jgi:hypothetical protein
LGPDSEPCARCAGCGSTGVAQARRERPFTQQRWQGTTRTTLTHYRLSIDAKTTGRREAQARRAHGISDVEEERRDRSRRTGRVSRRSPGQVGVQTRCRSSLRGSLGHCERSLWRQGDRGDGRLSTSACALEPHCWQGHGFARGRGPGRSRSRLLPNPRSCRRGILPGGKIRSPRLAQSSPSVDRHDSADARCEVRIDRQGVHTHPTAANARP